MTTARTFATCLVFWAAFGSSLRAQVFEINGGSSSLYQSNGGSVKIHTGNYDATVGVGTIGSHFTGGAQVTALLGKNHYTVGMNIIPDNLPTDIFDQEHFFPAVGVTVRRTGQNSDLLSFAGYSTQENENLFFTGSSPNVPTAAVLVHRSIGSTLTIGSELIMSHLQTAIGSLSWRADKHTVIAMSAGLGSNRPYSATSLSVVGRWVDLKAAYIGAGSQFRRVDAKAFLSAEPDRENIILTLHPCPPLTHTAGHQNFLSPQAFPLEAPLHQGRSQVNNLSSNLHIRGAGLSASLLTSDYGGRRNISEVYSAAHEFSSTIAIQISYLASKNRQSTNNSDLISNIEERLNNRFSLSELISISGGRSTVSFGGSFMMSSATFSLDYQTYYVASKQSPFEQAMILDTKITLPHGLRAHSGTVVSPDGRVLYTSDFATYLVRNPADGSSREGDHLERGAIGGMVLRGQVQDTEGHPISGAAILLDKSLVFSNDSGAFYLRERTVHTHQVSVQVDQFLGGGAYKVISAPKFKRSCPDADTAGTLIIVQKL